MTYHNYYARSIINKNFFTNNSIYKKTIPNFNLYIWYVISTKNTFYNILPRYYTNNVFVFLGCLQSYLHKLIFVVHPLKETCYNIEYCFFHLRMGVNKHVNILEFFMNYHNVKGTNINTFLNKIYLLNYRIDKPTNDVSLFSLHFSHTKNFFNLFSNYNYKQFNIQPSNALAISFFKKSKLLVFNRGFFWKKKKILLKKIKNVYHNDVFLKNYFDNIFILQFKQKSITIKSELSSLEDPKIKNENFKYTLYGCFNYLMVFFLWDLLDYVVFSTFATLNFSLKTSSLLYVIFKYKQLGQFVEDNQFKCVFWYTNSGRDVQFDFYSTYKYNILQKTTSELLEYNECVWIEAWNGYYQTTDPLTNEPWCCFYEQTENYELTELYYYTYISMILWFKTFFSLYVIDDIYVTCEECVEPEKIPFDVYLPLFQTQGISNNLLKSIGLFFLIRNTDFVLYFIDAVLDYRKIPSNWFNKQGVFYLSNFYKEPINAFLEDYYETFGIINRFWLFYMKKYTNYPVDFVFSRFEQFFFYLTRYSQFFRFFFPISKITFYNRYPFSFFLTSNVTFINHKKKIVQNITMSYIQPKKRVFVTLKFLKLFLTFKKNIFFSDRIYYLLKYAFVTKNDYLNKFVNTIFKFFNKNLNNRFIKGNLGLNKVKYEKELLEKTLLKYTITDQKQRPKTQLQPLRPKNQNFSEQKKKNVFKKKITIKLQK